MSRGLDREARDRPKASQRAEDPPGSAVGLETLSGSRGTASQRFALSGRTELARLGTRAPVKVTAKVDPALTASGLSVSTRHGGSAASNSRKKGLSYCHRLCTHKCEFWRSCTTPFFSLKNGGKNNGLVLVRPTAHLSNPKLVLLPLTLKKTQTITFDK